MKSKVEFAHNLVEIKQKNLPKVGTPPKKKRYSTHNFKEEQRLWTIQEVIGVDMVLPLLTPISIFSS